MQAVIVGAGIGGLAAGLALSKIGWQIKVYERAPEIRTAGTGLIIWNNALQALERLGVKDEFQNQSYLTHASLFDQHGSLIVDGQKLPDSLRSLWVVHRSDLLAILSAKLEAHRITFNANCVRCEPKGDHALVHISDGRSVEADLVIAADGLHSRLRAGFGHADQPVYAGYTAWRAIIDYDSNKIVPGEFWGPHGRFGFVPMTKQRVLWFATKNALEGTHSPDGEKQETLRTFGTWHSSIAPLIHATDESAIIRNDVYDRAPITNWVKGRAALLGDAAHAMTPVLGQGACQALEDAVVLGACLQKTSDVEKALYEYQNYRVQRANFFVKYARIVGKLGQLRSQPFLTMRNMALTLSGIANGQMNSLDKLVSAPGVLNP